MTLTGFYVWTFLAQMRSDIKVNASYLWAAIAFFCFFCKNKTNWWLTKQNNIQKLRNITAIACVSLQILLFFSSLGDISAERINYHAGFFHELVPSGCNFYNRFQLSTQVSVTQANANYIIVIILPTHTSQVLFGAGSLQNRHSLRAAIY